MGCFMENRVYPDNILIFLYEERDHDKKHGEQYILETCIGTGANCVTYQAAREDGIPVRLKQFRPAGLDRRSSVFRVAEERFIRSYHQQIAMMRDEGVSAITFGKLHGGENTVKNPSRDLSARETEHHTQSCREC